MTRTVQYFELQHAVNYSDSTTPSLALPEDALGSAAMK